MEVVGHQTIVVEPQAEPALVAPEQTQKGLTALVIGEDRLAVVASVHEMEAGFAGPLVAAWNACHRRLLSRRSRPSSEVRFYFKLCRLQ
jgi:hypothetical protein